YYGLLSPCIVIADKEMLQEILVKQFANFSERKTLYGFVGAIEHSLLHQKGEQWKRTRSIMSPTFTAGKMRKIVPFIQDACDTMLKTTRNAIKHGDSGQVEVHRLFGGYTMDVISSTAFGIHVDSQSNKNDPFIFYGSKLARVSFFSPAILLVDQKDFLRLMVDAQEDGRELDGGDKHFNKGLTFNDILANTILFFVAGYDTTNITLTMNAYHLATNPECQEKLRQEIKTVFGSGRIDYENLTKLRYLDMCLSEVLRLHPPFVRFTRTCVKTTKIKNLTIPTGMMVIVPVDFLHHDPDVWEKPESFNPERFSEAEKAYEPLDYIPFGHGPRKCIASRLAFLEAKMITAELVRNFRLSVGNKTVIRPKLHDRSPVQSPLHLWLKLEEIRQTQT
ncbi:cytochrome P450 3A29-like, partial [Mizuhopecten yessoensis]|uniref:cytochrome P450 3A29-like n=1 Tax=Mizuhopecten yessoensis TaxID=6573 RepID=UPI000B458261